MVLADPRLGHVWYNNNDITGSLNTMIKLIINPENSPEVKSFGLDEVKIGSGKDFDADLILPLENLQPNHIKILKKEQQYLIFNLANDPFVTLNGLPFGKRFLKNFDLIQIGKTLIRFEILEEVSPSKKQSLSIEKSPSVEKPKAFTPLAANSPPNPEKWINKIDEQLCKLIENKDKVNDEDSESNQAISESEKHDATFKGVEKEPPTSPLDVPKKNYTYTLSEFDDECENWNQEKDCLDSSEIPPDEPTPKSYSWKLWFWLLIFCSSIAALLATYYYLTLYNQSYDEEIRAAEGVADISMALKYAQINHIRPNQQNWSDPDFIKNNLASVVTHDYPIFENLDSRGHFINTPYLLRIYTSTDFSQFVVIAQPAPSLWQKIIPKSSIIVDSKAMELRKIPDLRNLNRLLVNQGTLDGAQAKDVTAVIKKGDLIPLTLIARKKMNQEFSPPKALTLIRPGAENFIYNAPRYYQLGENIMRKALHLLETPGSSHEVARLKQEMSMVSKMPHMIFYSSLGIQFANEAQKALASFSPHANFLTAYITFNSRGSMINSHLLMDEISDLAREKQKNLNTIALSKEVKKEIQEIDVDDPLFFKLSALASKRQDLLQPLYNQIISLINNNFDSGEMPTNNTLVNLVEEYLNEDLKLVTETGLAIEKLQDEYSSLSKQQFYNFLLKTNLHKQLERYNQLIADQKSKKTVSTLQLEKALQKIEDTQNLTDLNLLLDDILSAFPCSSLKCDQESILLQNRIRTNMISKLNKLIFNSSNLSFTKEEQGFLESILNRIWISEPHEKSFYLNEYERLKK